MTEYEKWLVEDRAVWLAPVDVSDAIRHWRWPNEDGFICPYCEHDKYYELREGKVLECASCHRQTTPLSGTIFHSIKRDLRVFVFATQKIHADTDMPVKRLADMIGCGFTSAKRVKSICMLIVRKREYEGLLKAFLGI